MGRREGQAHLRVETETLSAVFFLSPLGLFFPLSFPLFTTFGG